jgi:hypothetical protein
VINALICWYNGLNVGDDADVTSVTPGPPGEFALPAGFGFIRAFHHKGPRHVQSFPADSYVLYKT